MQAVFNHLDFFLNKQDSFSLSRAAGTAVTVKRGSVWVTQDGHQEDHVLEAGQRLVIRDGAGVLISALHSAEVTVDGGNRRGALARAWRGLLAAYLRSFRPIAMSRLAAARAQLGRGSTHYPRHLL